MKMLVVVAHPDDETFGCGSVLAHAAARGVETVVACATRGELGEIAPGSGAQPADLGDVREAELRAAAQELGVARVVMLGWRACPLRCRPVLRRSSTRCRCGPGSACWRSAVPRVRRRGWWPSGSGTGTPW